MFELNRRFKQLGRRILPVLLAGLVWLLSLPAAMSVQADPANFGGQGQEISKSGNRPFGERGGVDIKQVDRGGSESDRQAAEAMPKDSGFNLKDIPEQIERAIDKLGNDQSQPLGQQD
jgi:hypothetical protein